MARLFVFQLTTICSGPIPLELVALGPTAKAAFASGATKRSEATTVLVDIQVRVTAQVEWSILVEIERI